MASLGLARLGPDGYGTLYLLPFECAALDYSVLWTFTTILAGYRAACSATNVHNTYRRSEWYILILAFLNCYS